MNDSEIARAALHEVESYSMEFLPGDVMRRQLPVPFDVLADLCALILTMHKKDLRQTRDPYVRYEQQHCISIGI